MRRSTFPLAALLATLVAAGASPLAAVDPFYVDLLRDGAHAYDRGDFAMATRHLRLACFGMLDEPKELAACLARLALAQDKAGDVAGFRDTFGRLVEIEERFQGYSQSSLPPEARAALEQRMAVQIPAPTLAASPPALRSAAGLKPQARPDPKPGEPAKPAPARPKEPSPVEVAPAPQPLAPPAAAPAGPATATAARPLTDDERKKQESARKILDGRTNDARQLGEAFQLAREVADAHPEQRSAQLLAGEAAYRISRWSDAAEYLSHAGGPGDDQPELLFYLAVSLFESGAGAGVAAPPLRRALPNLQRSPYVDGYTKKILGQ